MRPQAKYDKNNRYSFSPEQQRGLKTDECKAEGNPTIIQLVPNLTMGETGQTVDVQTTPKCTKR